MLILKKNLLISRIRRFLIVGFSKRAGKNCFGRKTIFTQSGGYKLFYNNIDYKRNLADIFILLRIEKNILYTSFLGFICYSNGYFCYILLSDFIKNIKTIYSGFVTYYKYAPSFLSLIPAGNFIHHVEVTPTKGVKLMRAAGTMCFIISKENNYSFLKMKSGWMLKLSNFCIAILGKMSNELHFVTRIHNAGKNRKLGFRPTVRGVAKNPCDHPHGGGEGTGSPPKAHKTPYGKLTKSPTTNKKFQKRNRILYKVFKK